MTIVEGVGIASVVTTLAYGFRWLVGLEGRVNTLERSFSDRMKALDDVFSERIKRLDERSAELMRANSELRSEVANLRSLNPRPERNPGRHG